MLIQGSNGITEIVNVGQNLEDATVEIRINDGNRIISKLADITDADKGLCEFTWTSDDLSRYGYYTYLAIVNYTNGDSFPTLPVEVKVEKSF